MKLEPWKRIAIDARSKERMLADAVERGWNISPNAKIIIDQASEQLLPGMYSIGLIEVDEKPGRAEFSTKFTHVVDQSQRDKAVRVPVLFGLMYAALNDPSTIGDRSLCFMHDPVRIPRPSHPTMERKMMLSLSYWDGMGRIGTFPYQRTRKLINKIGFVFRI